MMSVFGFMVSPVSRSSLARSNTGVGALAHGARRNLVATCRYGDGREARRGDADRICALSNRQPSVAFPTLMRGFVTERNRRRRNATRIPSRRASVVVAGTACGDFPTGLSSSRGCAALRLHCHEMPRCRWVMASASVGARFTLSQGIVMQRQTLQSSCFRLRGRRRRAGLQRLGQRRPAVARRASGLHDRRGQLLARRRERLGAGRRSIGR